MTFAEMFPELLNGKCTRILAWSPGTFLRMGETPLIQLFIPGTGMVTWSPRQAELLDNTWQTFDTPPAQGVVASGFVAFKSKV